MAGAGWSRVFDELHRVISDSHRQIGIANEEFVQYIIEKIETGLRGLNSIHQVIRNGEQELLASGDREIASIYDRNVADLVTCLQSMLSYWHLHQDTSGTGYRFQVVHLPGRRGRPAFGIASSQLEYLHSLGFTWTEMAALLGVSRMTLYRRRHEFGMLNNPARTVSDQELTQHVQRLRASSPYTGESMILGQLRALNVNVSRERVRHTIRQIDPLNTLLRWGGNLTSRRPYSVPGPNSLWHIGM